MIVKHMNESKGTGFTKLQAMGKKKKPLQSDPTVCLCYRFYKLQT